MATNACGTTLYQEPMPPPFGTIAKSGQKELIKAVKDDGFWKPVENPSHEEKIPVGELESHHALNLKQLNQCAHIQLMVSQVGNMINKSRELGYACQFLVVDHQLILTGCEGRDTSDSISSASRRVGSQFSGVSGALCSYVSNQNSLFGGSFHGNLHCLLAFLYTQ